MNYSISCLLHYLVTLGEARNSYKMFAENLKTWLLWKDIIEMERKEIVY
jgi:hypothetical protein